MQHIIIAMLAGMSVKHTQWIMSAMPSNISDAARAVASTDRQGVSGVDLKIQQQSVAEDKIQQMVISAFQDMLSSLKTDERMSELLLMLGVDPSEQNQQTAVIDKCAVWCA